MIPPVMRTLKKSHNLCRSEPVVRGIPKTDKVFPQSSGYAQGRLNDMMIRTAWATPAHLFRISSSTSSFNLPAPYFRSDPTSPGLSFRVWGVA